MLFQYFLTVAFISFLVGSVAAAFDKPGSWTEVVGGICIVAGVLSFIGFLFTFIWWV